MNHKVTERAGGSRLMGRLAGLGAAVLLSLAMTAGVASAEMQRPLLHSFGKDGTSATNFEANGELAFQQADNKLYAYNLEGESGIWGFNVPGAGTYTPFGAAPFINVGYPGPGYGLEVDNSTLNSKGRIYTSTQFGRLVDAWDETGAHMPAPFPLLTPPPDNPNGLAVDSQGNVFMANQGQENAVDLKGVLRWNRFGSPLPPINTVKQPNGTEKIAFDSEDNLYVGTGQLWKYTAASAYTESIPIHPEMGTLTVEVDKTDDHLYIGAGEDVWEYDADGNLIRKFGDTFGVVSPSPSGLAVNEATGEIFVSMSNRIRVFGAPVLLPDLTTKRPENVTTTSAIVNGNIDLDGGPPVTECFFQYGTEQSYAETPKPCEPAVSPGDPIEAETDVHAQLTLLSPGSMVNYRLVTKTANGYNVGQNQTLIAREAPLVKGEEILEVTSDNAQLRAEVNPQSVVSTYRYEYGPEDCAISACESTPPQDIVKCGVFFCPSPPDAFVPAPIEIGGLTPGTEYHFRVVTENDQAGVGYGTDHIFHTFALDPSGVDPCPNANERKQSQGGKLARCRAYELVSAADAAGYDVLSNITGRKPLSAYPHADDRFLYTMSDGKLPGIDGFPVNLGTDPYVATRGAHGWSTTYEGLPATLPSASPFASTASGANATLSTFAFAEPDVCAPCFSDGSGGIPLRRPDGELVQGMKGSVPVPLPKAAGDVAKYLSDDGTHFVFGSEQKFEAAGVAGSVMIYDRNLSTDTTQVVSTMPNGSTMTGKDIAELDVSADGSRILIGKLVRTDAEGNPYYDLYMHVGSSPNSVMVADTLTGVLYSGMSDDGTKVFFTTADVLADDTDASADLFRADVGPSAATVARVSTGSGGSGQSNGCAPPENWNVTEGGPDCSTLAIAGGGGVASGDGTVYFISPEQLDGLANGLKDQPNLYSVVPGGQTEFVAVLDNSAAKPPPMPPKRPLLGDPLISGTSGPNGLAIDEQTGAVYVVESNQGRLSRFTAAGAQMPFTDGPGTGTNKISLGFGQGGRAETGIGVDRAPGSPLNGMFYVKENTGTVGVYESTGLRVGEVTIPAELCGLAVDQSNGDLYTSAYPNIKRYRPVSPTIPITNEDYEETGIDTPSIGACQVAVDKLGNVYGANWSEGPVRRFQASDFAAPPPSVLGTEVDGTGISMATDPVNNQLYIAQDNRISVYEPDGTLDGSVGVGSLSSSNSVAVRGSNRNTYAGSNNNRIKLYGYEEFPYVEIDHPAIGHATEHAYERFADDLQITSDGDHATFQTRIGQAGAPSGLLQHVYHHRAPTGQLDCVSCKPTKAVGVGDAFLTLNGANLSDDGRVFFTSIEQLALRDTNRRTDAYEWEEGENPGAQGTLNLISTGTGIFDAALASVDSTGKNVFFFTREPIVVQDVNGQVMKVYTAREGGGFGYVPQGVQCQAADECRGAGTEVAPPPAIGTYKGEGGNAGRNRTCRKGFKKKNGKCVRKKKRNHKKNSNSRTKGRASR